MRKQVLKWTIGISLFLIPFSCQATAQSEMTPAEKNCAFKASLFADFTLPLQTSCNTKDDCVVIDDHCLPVRVVTKEKLADEKIKNAFDQRHEQLLKACDSIIHSKNECPRNINVRCDNHVCGASDIIINPSAFK